MVRDFVTRLLEMSEALLWLWPLDILKKSRLNLLIKRSQSTRQIETRQAD
jgi:hypothetical protein